MDYIKVEIIMDCLASNGSYAADYYRPEGIVIFHTGANVAFKKTFDKDTEGKGK